MSQRMLLGMLTPSSNTVLEPVCAAMLAGVPRASVHFSRFRVTDISLDEAALGQFRMQPMIDAAALLTDAHVDAICWNGTSASWLGFEQDRALCGAISGATGIATTSSVLALEQIFRKTGVRRFGLVSPYLGSVQERIVQTFRKEGLECAAERHLEIRDNRAFADVTGDTLKDMVRAVAETRPDAICILCTNLNGAPLVEALEAETGIPVYDSVATAVWGALRAAKTPPDVVKGWGRLFREVS
jgi:maleate isomerase